MAPRNPPVSFSNSRPHRGHARASRNHEAKIRRSAQRGHRLRAPRNSTDKPPTSGYSGVPDFSRGLGSSDPYGFTEAHATRPAVPQPPNGPNARTHRPRPSDGSPMSGQGCTIGGPWVAHGKRHRSGATPSSSA